MTQADLAKAINEKPAVINQYENGKALPNGQVRFATFGLDVHSTVSASH